MGGFGTTEPMGLCFIGGVVRLRDIQQIVTELAAQEDGMGIGILLMLGILGQVGCRIKLTTRF